jgi:hypothetical protein
MSTTSSTRNSRQSRLRRRATATVLVRQQHLPDSEPRTTTRITATRTRVTDSCIRHPLSSSAGGVGFGWIGFSMTKNRALKRAAHERAHLTGERYVVARRKVESGVPEPAALPSGAMASTLHRWTHLVPGVPAHPDSATLAVRHSTAQGPRLTGRRNPTHSAPPVREKRVLRGWQEWIESRVTRK